MKMIERTNDIVLDRNIRTKHRVRPDRPDNTPASTVAVRL
jgi:hypothetical protein